MIEMREYLKIPKNRIGVIIGIKGQTKIKIENETKTKVIVDSNDNTVTIESTKDTEDPTLVWVARDIIKAIARGFSETKAFQLLNDDFFLEIIHLEKKSKRNQRIKGRIIGEKGKTRHLIEECTKVYISVFGETIAIIGDLKGIPFAKKAIEMLITGVSHTIVYRYLERLRMEEKLEPPQLWEEKIEFK